ncbi:MAG: DUF5131 family protein [Desulfovibrionaceae bacterium]
MSKIHGIAWLNMPGFSGMTWNPVTGCTPISEGCANCYAKELAETRLAGRCGYDKEDPFKVKLHESRMRLPQWRAPRMVFVCSMSDLFHEDVPFPFVDRVFTLMAQRPRSVFCLLTKRAARMNEYVLGASAAIKYEYETGKQMRWPLPNVWLGVTAENQYRANERIPYLLDTPAARRFVSVEPMLGPVCLERIVGCDALFRPLDGLLGVEGRGWVQHTRIDWVICGGESGDKSRPMHADWARSLRGQCHAENVSYFFKQWGTWAFAGGDSTHILSASGELFPLGSKGDDCNRSWPCARVGLRKAGHLLDGVEYRTWPEITA